MEQTERALDENRERPERKVRYHADLRLDQLSALEALARRTRAPAAEYVREALGAVLAEARAGARLPLERPAEKAGYCVRLLKSQVAELRALAAETGVSAARYLRAAADLALSGRTPLGVVHGLGCGGEP